MGKSLKGDKYEYLYQKKAGKPCRDGGDHDFVAAPVYSLCIEAMCVKCDTKVVLTLVDAMNA